MPTRKQQVGRSPAGLERWRGGIDEKLNAVVDGITRIEKAIVDHVHRDDEVQDDLCDRVGKLETGKANLSGKLAVVTFIASIVTSAVAAAVAKAWVG